VGFFLFVKQIVSSLWMLIIGGRGAFKSLKTKTAMVVPGALPKHACDEMIFRMEKFLANIDSRKVWQDDKGSDTRILGFEDLIPDLLGLFRLDENIKAVESYTGRRARSWFLMANKLVPKDENLGSGGGMHRDSPFSHQVKCIWYLNDVSSENGPFQYIPESNVGLIRARSRFPLGQTRFDELTEKAVEVTGDAGTLLVCDTKCIHGGKPILDGVRYAVTLYTLPKKEGKETLFRKSGLMK
jgi:hypothetical protein|tara:strand:- start:1106 stop:1828 length:723 start_codon:yes stop_codon:yes gene_type:complete